MNDVKPAKHDILGNLWIPTNLDQSQQNAKSFENVRDVIYEFARKHSNQMWRMQMRE